MNIQILNTRWFLSATQLGRPRAREIVGATREFLLRTSVGMTDSELSHPIAPPKAYCTQDAETPPCLHC